MQACLILPLKGRVYSAGDDDVGLVFPNSWIHNHWEMSSLA